MATRDFQIYTFLHDSKGERKGIQTWTDCTRSTSLKSMPCSRKLPSKLPSLQRWKVVVFWWGRFCFPSFISCKQTKAKFFLQSECESLTETQGFCQRRISCEDYFQVNSHLNTLVKRCFAKPLFRGWRVLSSHCGERNPPPPAIWMVCATKIASAAQKYALISNFSIKSILDVRI